MDSDGNGDGSDLCDWKKVAGDVSVSLISKISTLGLINDS